ncbi:hypothetical protein AH156_19780 [Salmonella enterica subsp. enterica serovar Enteritidis]|nr:hypothetical protein [Salmonella enterica subsp. enterica serovar Enteritidis]
MKRTIAASALVFASLTGFAHADRDTQVNLRVTEVTVPMMSAATRMGEPTEQMANDLIAIRGDMLVVFGQIYDMGALLKERGEENPADKMRAHMTETIKREEWAKPLNAAERAAVIEAMVHVAVDGYRGA